MIDWQRVAELRDAVGADEFPAILELFLDEVEGVVMRLSAESPRQLGDDLHFLKGSAWNLGFAEFGRLCEAGETLAGRGRAGLVSVDELMGSYSASKQLFMRDLARVFGDEDGGAMTGVA